MDQNNCFRTDPRLEPLLEKVGVPEPRPFRADDFQTRAVELIKEHDVLVTAPTGAGKTWIALQAIHSCLSRGLNMWYASPLKALSNSIHETCREEFGPEACGILTGDRKENPEAPIIVGTTEILRNRLYDVMSAGGDIRADLVVLDEAHYLNDMDRGVVWEEVLIYLPVRVRILLLSATISNVGEILGWLNEIREVPTEWVGSMKRPVPLEPLFLFPDGLLIPMGVDERLDPRIVAFQDSLEKNGSMKQPEMDYGFILSVLRAFDLLPAIFFLKSRKNCDLALSFCPPADSPEAERKRRDAMLEDFLHDHPHLEGHRQLDALVNSRVCSHHAGQLPYWKSLVEKMMNAGHIDAIFSTSTIAAGVNFPARTVVLLQSVRYNGRELIDLTATEFHQMTGRAGRRGKDNIGFAVAAPGPFQDPEFIYRLHRSSADPVVSRIHVNFSMPLNLLKSQTPSDIHTLLHFSLSAYQKQRTDPGIRKRWERKLAELKSLAPDGGCDTGDPYEVMENIQKMSEAMAGVNRFAPTLSPELVSSAFKKHLHPGRLFQHVNGKRYVVFRASRHRGKITIAAYNIEKAIPNDDRMLALKPVSIDEVQALFDYRIELPKLYDPEKLNQLFDAVPFELSQTVNIGENGDAPPVSDSETGTGAHSLPCRSCGNRNICHGKSWRRLRELLRDFKLLATKVEMVEGGLWLSFKRHLRFLKETGFVDDEDRLTLDGVWASRLRLDQPLLIAEVIRKGGFSSLGPELLAGGAASFAWDGIQAQESRVDAMDMPEVKAVFERIQHCIKDISSLKRRRGFDVTPVRFWPAALMFTWASGEPWDRLLRIVRIDEGDLASLVMRTADHLRQVSNLKKHHPRLARVADRAIQLISREPVY